MDEFMSANKECSMEGVTAFGAGLFMGTFSTITIKIVYGMESIGLDGTRRLFEKPLTTTWFMFLAMLVALPLYFIHHHYIKVKDGKPLFSAKVCALLFIPTVFDLFGTALAKIGLLYCTVSVYQLVRCTVIIITAILKAFVLKDHLEPYMWAGVFINLFAMCLISAVTFFDKDNKSGDRDPRMGVFYILLSCIVQGTQYVYEEKVMTHFDAHPLVVVGMEGFWGSILMALFVFPLAYYLPGEDMGSLENVYDSFEMIKNSKPIQSVLIAFFVTVAGYNIFSIFVTNYLSSIWHAILDNFRPVSVWGTDLLIYYVFTHGQFGEAWTPYSWLQFSGMCILFFGTAVYNGSVPGFDYSHIWQPPEEAEEAKGRHRRTSSAEKIKHMTPILRTPSRLASPALMQSPLIRKNSLDGYTGLPHHVPHTVGVRVEVPSSKPLNVEVQNVQSYGSTSPVRASSVGSSTKGQGQFRKMRPNAQYQDDGKLLR